MYHLRDAYDSDTAPTVATGVLAVGVSLMFTVGLFLIITAHNNNQSQELQQAVAAIRKSQTEGIDINTALAQVKAASVAGKSKPDTTSAPTGPVHGSFDTITVKGTSTLQGNVKVEKDVSVNGKITTKGELQVSGSIIRNGSNLDDLFIQNTSEDPQTGTAVTVDSVSAGELAIDGDASIGGDLTIDGAASFGGDTTIGGDASIDGGASISGDLSADNVSVDSDLTVSGLIDASDLTVSGNAAIEGTLTVSDAVTLEDNLTVTGNTTLTGNLAVGGSITIDGTNINDMFIQNAGDAITPDIDIQGDISSATLTTSGGVTIGGNLDISGGGHILGNDDTKGTETISSGDSTVHHDFDTAYASAPVVVVSPVTQAVLFKVTATTGGFDITLSGPAGADLDFNYLVQE